MNWLFPGFLFGTLAVGIPFALHLLRRRAQRPVVFPSFRFLAPSSRRIESARQRISRWLVLALRSAVFILLAIAFARPFQNRMDATRERRAVVVVIDNSFSLQAAGRWEELKKWAIEKTGTFAEGDKLGLMLMAPQPVWIIAPTNATEPARHTLTGLAPGWMTASIEPALRMAGDALAAIPADRREIIVLTDHQRLSWSGADFSKKLPPGIVMTFPSSARPVERQASVLPPALAATERGIRATVVIHNFTGPQRRSLRAYRDGAPLPVREDVLDLGREERRTVELNLPGATDRAAFFRFSLDADDLPADDSAYAVWQPAGEGPLLVDQTPAGSDADFVAVALTAAAELTPALKLVPLPSGAWPVQGVAILRNDSSFVGATAERLETFLAAGGSALVFASNGPAQLAWLKAHGLTLSPLPERSEPWQAHDWNLEHPLIAALSQRRLEILLGWDFKSGWSLPVNAITPLARWSETAVAVGEWRVGTGRVVVCGFSPDRRAGDWPVQPAFVPFLHQTAAYLFRIQQTVLVAGRTGQTLALDKAIGKWRALEGPDARRPAIDVIGSVTPATPGIYEFSQGNDRKIFAINVLPEESDLAAWDAGTPWLGLASDQPAPPSTVPRTELAAIDAEQAAPLWWWAAAAAVVLMLAELTFANRTAR